MLLFIFLCKNHSIQDQVHKHLKRNSGFCFTQECNTKKRNNSVRCRFVTVRMYGILDEHIFFYLQKGNVLNEVPLNSTYWAPVDAHDPVRVQQIMLGLTKTSAEKMDLALARDTKICESFICLLIKPSG